MAAAAAERPQSAVGPKIGGPVMKKQASTGRQMTNIANFKSSG